VPETNNQRETELSVSEKFAGEAAFGDYVGAAGHFDEVHAGVGKLRPPWRRFVELSGRLGTDEFARRWEQARRLLHQTSLAYPDPRDPTSRRRPWELDPFPLLLGSQEWKSLAAAIRQRATLLDLVLRDLYGPQQLVERGILPAEVVFRHPGFRLPYCGQQPRLGRFLQFYAADLARSPDGRWWVVADHCEAPTGVGYALENRLAMSRMLPDIFRQCQVERLAPYFVEVRAELARIAPQRDREVRIVMMTQEAGSHAYFEDAYLARYLGYTLVEAGDLAVRNNELFMKTLGGLSPVDVLVRRLGSEECDPLELSDRSAFGVAGLMQAAQSGTVAVANTLGSGLVESPVVMAFLPQLCQALLDEPLAMPGVATWWCGDAESRRYVLGRLEELDIQPAYRRRGSETAEAFNLARLSPPDLAARIVADPAAYVAQERIDRSTAPTWSDAGVDSAFVSVRTFAVANATGYAVMPGGLTRVSTSLESLRLSIVEGQRSKDTWVLADAPVAQITLLKTSDDDVPLRRGGAELPSRVAEHFFWLGRQSERAESLARLLRTVILRLTSESNAALVPELPSLLRVLAERGQIEPGFVVEEIKPQLPAIESLLPSAVFDDGQPNTLRSTVSRLAHLAAVVRDRISIDTWRILRQMDEQFVPGKGSDPFFDAPSSIARNRLPKKGSDPLDTTGTSLAETLERIDELLVNLSAFTGLVLENMTRTHAWQFLHLGRRLERGVQTASLIRIILQGNGATEYSTLEALLETADSLMTYRSRYLARVQLAPVLDLLLTDETNPRSVAYALASCAEQVALLPREANQLAESPEQQLATSLLHTIRQSDSRELARAYLQGDTGRLEQLLNKIVATLPKLSNAVSHRYLIHVGPTQRLAEIA
jgi:uncharacterized circularly permuted ATP-grasp superfamily protein/uncharacterized alpha-E superfamily protein